MVGEVETGLKVHVGHCRHFRSGMDRVTRDAFPFGLARRCHVSLQHDYVSMFETECGEITTRYELAPRVHDAHACRSRDWTANEMGKNSI